ncbi:hypothetical protein VNO77_30691 [Canavalia gladiata]|uniref:Uncharacterized protein n=1 Tax=Canavalia gladiata TaxID=3824 RepID=A0AAN9KR26_CANGL
MRQWEAQVILFVCIKASNLVAIEDMVVIMVATHLSNDKYVTNLATKPMYAIIVLLVSLKCLLKLLYLLLHSQPLDHQDLISLLS